MAPLLVCVLLRVNYHACTDGTTLGDLDQTKISNECTNVLSFALQHCDLLQFFIDPGVLLAAKISYLNRITTSDKQHDCGAISVVESRVVKVVGCR